MALLLPPGPNDNTIGKQDVWSGLREGGRGWGRGMRAGEVRAGCIGAL